MNRNFPLIIAVAGGALIYFLWQQRQASAAVMQPGARIAPSPSSVPQEWIEATPEGYPVIGTTGDPWDILT